MIQDSKGFIWIGAGNGFFHYDGYEFNKIDLEISPRLDNWYELQIFSFFLNEIQ